jgi:DNA-binding NtrC family response regulator
VLLGDAEIAADPEPSQSAPMLGETFDDRLSFRAAKERAVARWERWYFSELVRRHDGNLSAAARTARMDRNYLRELMRRTGVRASED